MHTCRRRAPTCRALVRGDHLDRPRAASADDARQRRSGLVVDHLRERAGALPQPVTAPSGQAADPVGATATTGLGALPLHQEEVAMPRGSCSSNATTRTAASRVLAIRRKASAMAGRRLAVGLANSGATPDTSSVPLSSRAYFCDRGSERPGSTPIVDDPWRRPRRVPTVVRRRGGRQVPCPCRSGVGQEHRRRPQRHEHDQKGQLEVGGGV